MTKRFYIAFIATILTVIQLANWNEQVRVFKMRGKRAKQFGQKVKGNPHYDIEKNGVFWNGNQINRHSGDFQKLIRRSYRSMFEQCPKVCDALLATGTKKLFHTIGNPKPHETILTEKELCDVLNELRKNYD